MTDDQYDQTDPDADAALTDPVFDALFSALREAGYRPAPPVRPELAALLSGARAGRRRRTVRGATAGLAVVGVLAGGVGAAAATGHLQQPQRPPVARVADHPAQVRSTPPVTRPTPSVPQTPAETDPNDVVDTRTDGVPDTQPARPPAGPTPGARGPETKDTGDDVGEADPTRTPAPQESEDDHADGDGGGSRDGGDDTGVSEGGTGDNGADGGG